jgi:amidophosphoribosyltransferase
MCAVFGVWNHEEAARITYLGLYAMQHRGQESSGIVSLHENKHIHHKGLGLVADVFKEQELETLKGRSALGHNRYSTTGQNLLTNAQPLAAELSYGPVAVAHNGNIVNSELIKKQLQAEGAIFHGTTDTETVLHLLSRCKNKDVVGALREVASQMVGAYSFVFLTDQKLIALRDPLGFRPLILGKKKNDQNQWAYVLASESCAFDLIGAQMIREIQPGELFWVDDSGEHSEQLFPPTKLAKCVFEHIYFSRPDSVVFSDSVYESRKSFGRWLAKENPVAADLVVPVPDSGVPAAIGYSQESGIPFEFGIIRNHYIGRTFIQPQQSIRSFGVKIKLNPQSAILKGKRVIVVDDSLVRGTTSQKIIALVRQAGAKEVHMRIACPPTTGPCYYGVDTPQKDHLIASQKSLAEIAKFIEADSLGYLSKEGMYKALDKKEGFCAACFDGKYPTELFR